MGMVIVNPGIYTTVQDEEDLDMNSLEYRRPAPWIGDRFI